MVQSLLLLLFVCYSRVWCITLNLETSYLSLESSVRKVCDTTWSYNLVFLSFSPIAFLNLLMDSLTYVQCFCVFCAQFSVIWDGLCHAFDFASLFLLALEDFLNNVDKKE